ncbi:MAG: nitrous oxide reductase family maturation protein NosD [Terriglobia bacterium]
MHPLRFRPWAVITCAVLFAAFYGPATATAANTLCVNPNGSHGCYAKIQTAVDAALPNETINVARGTYTEEVLIGKPLSLIGAGADPSVIDATGLAHGIFVDGLDYPGLNGVTIAGFTVKNALFEGILVVSASDVTIRDNQVVDNDKSQGLEFTGAPMGCTGQPGNGIYENDESGDCGGAIHLIGTVHSILSGNLITGNADGVLISDETAESRDNLLIHNAVKDNPLECGIVLASHPPMGAIGSPHHGVHHNTVAENVSTGNGVKVGGSGVGLFSDGIGQGRASENVIIRNTLTNNGLGGVALHTHVGPAFGLPADNMNGNMIIDNYIAGNLADQDDTATPGSVGININSGGGGSPVYGTIISQNVIRDEDIDIAVNTPAQVDIHLNDLLGGKAGVEDVCAYDGSSACTGSIDTTQNFWGCPAGPGGPGCTTISGTDILFAPWLRQPIGDDGKR